MLSIPSGFPIKILYIFVVPSTHTKSILHSYNLKVFHTHKKTVKIVDVYILTFTYLVSRWEDNSSELNAGKNSLTLLCP